MQSNIISLIYEKLNTEIPDSVKQKLKSTKIRQEMKKKYKGQVFLDSENLKFPIVNPETGKKDCKLIYAAFLRATIHSSRNGSKQQPKEYYDNIRNTAKSLYESEGCSEKLKVKLNKEDVEISIINMNDIFEIEESEYDSLLNNTEFTEV
jgi:hypothetical protein